MADIRRIQEPVDLAPSARALFEALTPEYLQTRPLPAPLEETRSPGKVQGTEHLPGAVPLFAGLDALTSVVGGGPAKAAMAGAAAKAAAVLSPAQIMKRLGELAGKIEPKFSSKVIKEAAQMFNAGQIPENLIFKGKKGTYDDWLKTLSPEDKAVHGSIPASVSYQPLEAPGSPPYKPLPEKKPPIYKGPKVDYSDWLLDLDREDFRAHIGQPMKKVVQYTDVHPAFGGSPVPEYPGSGPTVPKLKSFTEAYTPGAKPGDYDYARGAPVADLTPREGIDEAARQARRVELGYTTPSYHGSPDWEGRSVKSDEFYSSAHPELASLYSGVYPSYRPEDLYSRSRVLPLYLNTKGYHEVDAAGKEWTAVNRKAVNEARRADAPGVTIRNVYDEPAGSSRHLGEPKTVHITLDPSRVRSQFAEFDPAKIKWNDILAGIAGGALAVPALRGSNGTEAQ